ncbi:MAG TPA: hypothetical protein VGH98_19810 [Gemmatimonadaceae bacterium]|jgi:hypothetical protein
MDIQIQFSRDGVGSVVVPGLAYAGVRTLAKLLPSIVPTSATLALLGALLWFAAAIYLFFVVTWQRDDNWLAAGLLIGLVIFGGALAADFLVGMLDMGSLARSMPGMLESSVGLILRTLVLIPASGGVVAGARWLTAEIGRGGAITR